MIVNRSDKTLLYIPDSRINWMATRTVGVEGKVILEVAVADVHGLSNSWSFIVATEEAGAIIQSHEDGNVIEFWEG